MFVRSYKNDGSLIEIPTTEETKEDTLDRVLQEVYGLDAHQGRHPSVEHRVLPGSDLYLIDRKHLVVLED